LKPSDVSFDCSNVLSSSRSDKKPIVKGNKEFIMKTNIVKKNMFYYAILLNTSINTQRNKNLLILPLP
jgi:hypothetical protein